MEITAVLVIFLIVFGFFTLYTQTTQVGSDLNSQTSQFVSRLRLAQSNARSGKNDSPHGVHLAGDKYVVFAGGTYVEGADANFEVVLPESIAIQNINLNGGGNDIVFSAPYGETSNFGTLDFAASQTGTVKTVTITQIGTVNY